MASAVLVAGGAGYVGSHACKALAEAGFIPVTYDNLSQGHAWAVRWGPFERGELADEAQLDDVIARHQPVAVLHFAASIVAGESMSDPAKYYSNNLVGTLSLLDAMRRAGLDRLVFSSTAAVYGDPKQIPIDEGHPREPVNVYGRTKLMCERILRDYASAYGLRCVALRYFNAAGADPGGEVGEAHEPETHLIPLVLEAAAGRRSGLQVYGNRHGTRDGTCVRDYVHVGDLADAHVLALRHLEQNAGFHAFNLGSAQGHSVAEVLDAARLVTGRTIEAELAPPRAGDPPSLVADPARAIAELGWQPRYGDLETLIEHAWRWHSADSRPASLC